ncbi:unnamed protein product [Phytophthora fragariaefolia]|uniref:Unnamed protein product n=1 Tax=Phytophthora fragariaefolia TaxID=1490495 RepID=A0A9W6XYV2_9STRA|nr:unnamed protein product [Phytophthora fragariaefolia]
MAKGIMLKKRGKVECADCHFGKQRRKTYSKKLDRNIERVNDLVFADLLIPGLKNGTQYSAVLVIMDAYSRFMTTYLLKSRTEEEVNPRMQEYIAWAESQHGVRVGKVVTREVVVDDVDGDGLVRQVLTDKGQEFCNVAIERWYKMKGIVHTKVGPNASQLNRVERTHQTLIGMVKTMMHQSGLPPSFWTHALETAVYVKNRVYCKGAGRTPYELMFGSKPDIHHIRGFGSATYCHTPVSKRKKLSINCRIGFLIGYREDVVECYVPLRKGLQDEDKWLQTFNELTAHGELDNLFDEEEEEEDDASFHQAEFDDDSVPSDRTSNVDMENVESDSVSERGRRLWDDVVRNSTPIDLDAASADPSDNSLPDYESDAALGETQEGDSVAESEYADADAETEVETHAHRSIHADEIESDDIKRENYNEDTTEVASRLCDSEEEIEAENDGDSEWDDGYEAEADASEDDDDSEVDDPEVDADDDERESTSHITDLVLVDTEDRRAHMRRVITTVYLILLMKTRLDTEILHSPRTL